MQMQNTQFKGLRICRAHFALSRIFWAARRREEWICGKNQITWQASKHNSTILLDWYCCWVTKRESKQTQTYLFLHFQAPQSPRDKISLSSNSRANETQSEPTLNERVSHATFGQAPQVRHRHHHRRQNGTKELENNKSVAGGGGGMFEHIHIWVNCQTWLQVTDGGREMSMPCPSNEGF